MENQIDTVEAPAEKPTFASVLKEHAVTLGLGVATFALAGWVAYDNHKRSNRVEHAYYDYLEGQLVLQADAFGAPTGPLLRDDSPQESDPNEVV